LTGLKKYRSDQEALKNITGIDHNLPHELCWIFDLSGDVFGSRKPVIIHTQAGREYNRDRTPDKKRLQSRRLFMKGFCGE
jgi:hypothetical protein